MKIQYLLPCLLLLMVSLLPVKANEAFGDSTNYSSSYEHPISPEEWDPEDYPNNEEDFDEGDFDVLESPDFERILEIVNEINEVYLALSNELAEYHNRNLQKVVNKLDGCVDFFSEAVDENVEDIPTNCKDGIKWGFKVFSKAISLLEQRKCDPVNITRRCIPTEIADKYIPQLKELYTELEEEVLVDEDEDGSPDICDYFEEWEDEELPSISEE